MSEHPIMKALKASVDVDQLLMEIERLRELRAFDQETIALAAKKIAEVKERAEAAEAKLAEYKANHLTAECGAYYASLCEGKGICMYGSSLTVTGDGLLYSVPSLAPRIVKREGAGEHLAYWAAACRWMENEEVK